MLIEDENTFWRYFKRASSVSQKRSRGRWEENDFCQHWKVSIRFVLHCSFLPHRDPGQHQEAHCHRHRPGRQVKHTPRVDSNCLVKFFFSRTDFGELFDMFKDFSESEIIGIGADLYPTYFQLTENYRFEFFFFISRDNLFSFNFQTETSWFSCGCSGQKSGQLKKNFRFFLTLFYQFYSGF